MRVFPHLPIVHHSLLIDVFCLVQYEEIAPILEDYARKMRDEENEPHEGKRKVETTWGIVSSGSLSLSLFS